MSIDLRKNRRIAGTVIIGLLFLFLVFSLVKTQLIDADQYKAAADSLAVSTSSVKASRGEILDCNGKPLVTNRQGNSVIFKFGFSFFINYQLTLFIFQGKRVAPFYIIFFEKIYKSKNQFISFILLF